MRTANTNPIGLLVAVQHSAHPVAFSGHTIIAALFAWFALLSLMLGIRVSRLRRARQIIRGALHKEGYEVLAMEYRHLRLGPFSLWDTARSQVVYRVVVRGSSSAEQAVWARWGRTWFNRKELELRWYDGGK